MKNSDESTANQPPLEQIATFVGGSKGLKIRDTNPGEIRIVQATDGKSISFIESDIEEVITRFDSESKTFLQVNFISGRKILITDTLIGFKPAFCRDLDMEKLPKVVTTPDLISVVEAIEDAMNGDASVKQEVELLRKVFESVLRGAESVGFDIRPERLWFQNVVKSNFKASA